ncbi:hypothetical protein IVA96_30310 [Bradyrhizobium sp. 159]|uniref:hypothetical protein n=1 Tax=Bradyrhizobium sp. 159 TaxID=2782632 RepID=UPI001FFA2A3B|nr:hypothetical protein [Bradyrhizobium sp. 159]MCK1620790.1 hypothetical protein [Bradyrhizobium sp. 159]
MVWEQFHKVSGVRNKDRPSIRAADTSHTCGWLGWKTITEAQRYIEEANRIRLAESAADKVRAGTAIGKPPSQFAKKGRKSLKSKRVKS